MSLYLLGGGGRSEAPLLREVVEALRGGPLVCVGEPGPASSLHARVDELRRLGVRDVRPFAVAAPAEIADVGVFAGARGVFFDTADPVPVAAAFRGSRAEPALRALLADGVVAGSSTGAAVLGEVVLTHGDSLPPKRAGPIVGVGIGLLPLVAVEPHFSERARLARLASVVATNPDILGLGIDEQTMAVIHGDALHVAGAGTVWVIDGRDIVASNIVQRHGSAHALGVAGLRVHALAAGWRMRLDTHAVEVPEALLA